MATKLCYVYGAPESIHPHKYVVLLARQCFAAVVEGRN